MISSTTKADALDCFSSPTLKCLKIGWLITLVRPISPRYHSVLPVFLTKMEDEQSTLTTLWLEPFLSSLCLRENSPDRKLTSTQVTCWALIIGTLVAVSGGCNLPWPRKHHRQRKATKNRKHPPLAPNSDFTVAGGIAHEHSQEQKEQLINWFKCKELLRGKKDAVAR